MKISQQFYQNLSNRTYKKKALLVFFFFLFSNASFSNGLYNEFEKLILEQKEKYNLLINKLTNKDFSIQNVKDINEVRIDPDFLNIIIQNTPSRYMLLAGNDRCSLYDLLQTKLLKSPNGEIKNIIFIFKDKNDKKQRNILPKEKFIKNIALRQCPNTINLKSHFKIANLRNTLKKISIKTPKSNESCLQNMEDFKKDVKTPYLCNMIETLNNKRRNEVRLNNLPRSDYKGRSSLQLSIDLANSYNKIISPAALDNLKGQCLNLSTPKKYCSHYFKQSFWSKAFIEKTNSPIVDIYCKNKKNKKACLRELNQNPEYCYYAGKDFPSIFPKPSCHNLSTALMNSKLYSNYNDCPSRTGNDAITSFARVLNHFDDYLTTSKNSCEINSIFPFVKFNEEYTDFEQWQVKLCFNDTLIGNENVCYPTILGNYPKDKLSLSQVVGKIASRLKGYNGPECKIVSQQEYKPSLLEFKSNCHIIRDAKNCSGTSCEFKVMLGEVPFTKFKIDSNLNFHLFSIDFTNENKSIKNLYTKNKKRKFKTIKNVSSLLNIYKKHKNVIFLGTGCAEELLPSYFTRDRVNQCTPLPFVIDGYIEDNGLYSFITRTSVDQLQAPRIIPWTFISSSIKQFRTLHPISSWSFYAIY